MKEPIGDVLNNISLPLPSTLPLIRDRFDLAGGCLYCVLVIASAAAKCCAFLILAPSDEYSSSPNLSVTVKRFLCAGPCSPVKRY